MIDTNIENMVPGLFYQFVYKARNIIGDSLYSKDVTVPVAD